MVAYFVLVGLNPVQVQCLIELPAMTHSACQCTPDGRQCRECSQPENVLI